MKIQGNRQMRRKILETNWKQDVPSRYHMRCSLDLFLLPKNEKKKEGQATLVDSKVKQNGPKHRQRSGFTPVIIFERSKIRPYGVNSCRVTTIPSLNIHTLFPFSVLQPSTVGVHKLHPCWLWTPHYPDSRPPFHPLLLPSLHLLKFSAVFSFVFLFFFLRQRVPAVHVFIFLFSNFCLIKGSASAYTHGTHSHTPTRMSDRCWLCPLHIIEIKLQGGHRGDETEKWASQCWVDFKTLIWLAGGMSWGVWKATTG